MAGKENLYDERKVNATIKKKLENFFHKIIRKPNKPVNESNQITNATLPTKTKKSQHSLHFSHDGKLSKISIGIRGNVTSGTNITFGRKTSNITKTFPPKIVVDTGECKWEFQSNLLEMVYLSLACGLIVGLLVKLCWPRRKRRQKIRQQRRVEDGSQYCSPILIVKKGEKASPTDVLVIDKKGTSFPKSPDSIQLEDIYDIQEPNCFDLRYLTRERGSSQGWSSGGPRNMRVVRSPQRESDTSPLKKSESSPLLSESSPIIGEHGHSLARQEESTECRDALGSRRNPYVPRYNAFPGVSTKGRDLDDHRRFFLGDESLNTSLNTSLPTSLSPWRSRMEISRGLMPTPNLDQSALRARPRKNFWIIAGKTQTLGDTASLDANKKWVLKEGKWERSPTKNQTKKVSPSVRQRSVSVDEANCVMPYGYNNNSNNEADDNDENCDLNGNGNNNGNNDGNDRRADDVKHSGGRSIDREFDLAKIKQSLLLGPSPFGGSDGPHSGGMGSGTGRNVTRARSRSFDSIPRLRSPWIGDSHFKPVGSATRLAADFDGEQEGGVMDPHTPQIKKSKSNSGITSTPTSGMRRHSGTGSGHGSGSGNTIGKFRGSFSLMGLKKRIVGYFQFAGPDDEVDGEEEEGSEEKEDVDDFNDDEDEEQQQQQQRVAMKWKDEDPLSPPIPEVLSLRRDAHASSPGEQEAP